jgi:uncharacterized protein (TIGR00369 family)
VPSAVTAPQFEQLIATHMSANPRIEFSVRGIEEGEATVVLRYSPTQLRPGDTISGPALFTLADTALYAAVLSVVGLEPLCVTSDMTIHFLRKPAPGDVEGCARVLKRGRRLVYGDVVLRSCEGREIVAHASGSYAVPAR